MSTWHYSLWLCFQLGNTQNYLRDLWSHQWCECILCAFSLLNEDCLCQDISMPILVSTCWWAWVAWLSSLPFLRFCPVYGDNTADGFFLLIVHCSLQYGFHLPGFYLDLWSRESFPCCLYTALCRMQWSSSHPAPVFLDSFLKLTLCPKTKSLTSSLFVEVGDIYETILKP